jgi:LmbE family N-acetylglucosaminyl deacetylase
MKRKILVIAPHPDDETLGCGGTLLRHAQAGHEIHWGIVTRMHLEDGWPPDRLPRRDAEIRHVSSDFGFASTTELGFRAGHLDQHPVREVVSRFADLLDAVRPDTLYLPHRGDAHSDHRATFSACLAASKVFRRPGLDRILSYETLSESDLVPSSSEIPFQPNFFVDATQWMDRKIEILSRYEGEILPAPFPRSPEAVRAQALLRGGQCGCLAAEGFMVLRDVWRRDP